MGNFEYTLKKDGQEIHLVFKDFALLPSEVSRKFRGRNELQLWAGLEWGIISPAAWPVPETAEGETPVATTKSTAIQDGLFDGVPIRSVMKLHNEWQEAADVNAGESTASSA